MDEQRRQAHLDAVRSSIAEMQVHTAEVLAAMDATLDEQSTTLEHPAHQLSGDALAAEVATVRVELLAASAALDAVRAEMARVAGPLMANVTFETMMARRHELGALSAEGERLAERVAVLKAALRELGTP